MELGPEEQGAMIFGVRRNGEDAQACGHAASHKTCGSIQWKEGTEGAEGMFNELPADGGDDDRGLGCEWRTFLQ